MKVKALRKILKGLPPDATVLFESRYYGEEADVSYGIDEVVVSQQAAWVTLASVDRCSDKQKRKMINQEIKRLNRILRETKS